jgi:hypothetical protein
MHPYSMHPSELKNCALVAAAEAERDGFTGTAAALILLAQACVSEARELEALHSSVHRPPPDNSTSERFHNLDIIH